MFIADEAMFSFKAYCEIKGDTEMMMESWVENEEIGGFTREYNFRTKTGLTIGPATTRVMKAQKYQLDGQSLVFRSSC
jgi:hypothetical protein